MIQYSETLINLAKDLLDECINRPTVKYTLSDRNSIISLHKAIKWIVDHAKPIPLENWDKELIVKMGYSPVFQSVNGGFEGKIPYNMNKNIQKELKDIFGDSDQGCISYYNENGDSVVESFYLKRPKYQGQPYVMTYKISVYDNNTIKSVCEKIINGEDFEYSKIENRFN